MPFAAIPVLLAAAVSRNDFEAFFLNDQGTKALRRSLRIPLLALASLGAVSVVVLVLHDFSTAALVGRNGVIFVAALYCYPRASVNVAVLVIAAASAFTWLAGRPGLGEAPDAWAVLLMPVDSFWAAGALVSLVMGAAARTGRLHGS